MRTAERRWYAHWQVWFCLVVVAVVTLVVKIVGAPFRLLESLWNTLF